MRPLRCRAGASPAAASEPRPRSLLEPVDVVQLPIVARCFRIRHASIVTATQVQCVRPSPTPKAMSRVRRGPHARNWPAEHASALRDRSRPRYPVTGREATCEPTNRCLDGNASVTRLEGYEGRDAVEGRPGRNGVLRETRLADRAGAVGVRGFVHLVAQCPTHLYVHERRVVGDVRRGACNDLVPGGLRSLLGGASDLQRAWARPGGAYPPVKSLDRRVSKKFPALLISKTTSLRVLAGTRDIAGSVDDWRVLERCCRATA